MPRPELSDRGRTFPRGLVLGLTMAEIAILIIFVLLLALAALLARETEQRRSAEQDLVRFEQMETLFEEEALPEDPAVLRAVLRERVDEHEDADSWRELVREIERAFPNRPPRRWPSESRNRRLAACRRPRLRNCWKLTRRSRRRMPTPNSNGRWRRRESQLRRANSARWPR